MMSVVEQIPPPRIQGGSKPRRNPRWAGFVHILSVRMKELRREPEVIFWVFGFPILLALGLGIAFRNKPADITSLAIISGSRAQDVLSSIERSPRKSSVHADVLDQQAAQRGFRLGKYDLVIEPLDQGGIRYHYDPSRPESVLARALADESL